MQKLFVFFALVLLPVFSLKSQEVIGSTGHQSSNLHISMAWTVGELMTETFSGPANILTQGFHQSMLRTTGLDKPVPGAGSITVYPNPTDDQINVVIHDADFTGFSARLMDFTGRILAVRTFSSPLETLDVSRFASGSYLIQVRSKDGLVIQNSKIIKN